MIIFLGNDKTTEAFANTIYQSSSDKMDIVLSCQYRYRVPESLLGTHSCVNIHFGRLPEYRGCNPIYWQMKNGEKYAGVTLHYMDSNFDTGNIIDIGEVLIDNKTADEVYDALLPEAVDMFNYWKLDIVMGVAPRRQQGKGKYYCKSFVDFSSEKYIDNLEDANAVSYKGKQNPIININGRDWELKPYESSDYR